MCKGHSTTHQRKKNRGNRDKICALLQIFLPIPENRELPTHVIVTKSMTQMRDMSMTIYLQRAKPARQIAVCKHALRQILTLLIITTSKHFVLVCAICHMPIHACAKLLGPVV